MLDTQNSVPAVSAETGAERSVRRSILRGWRRRCPRCGAGPLFRGYVKLRAHCPVCQEELHQARTVGSPAYVTAVIVAALLVPIALFVAIQLRPDPLMTLTGFAVGCTALTLYLLPRLKGLIVGLQWAKRKHGFANA